MDSPEIDMPPDSQWPSVEHAMQARIGQAPVWLNTAGGGVPWLHLRIDSRPKYYTFEPYRKCPDQEPCA